MSRKRPVTKLLPVLLFLLLASGAFLVIRSGISIGPHPGRVSPLEIKNYYGKTRIFYPEKNSWEKPHRGQLISDGYALETGPDSELNFAAGENIRIRLKENSEGRLEIPAVRAEEVPAGIRLEKGKLLASIRSQDPQGPIYLAVSRTLVEVRSGMVMLEILPGENRVLLGVLRGSALVWIEGSKEAVPVASLEKLEITPGDKPEAVSRVSKNEWREMREAYELVEKSAAVEAMQMDLSQKAGTLFEKVFDHGTFFHPKMGFAAREFVQDPDGEVRLVMEYDVFPAGSFVGTYMKTRDFDASLYEGLQFDVRRVGDEGFPQNIKVELKSGGQVTRAFAIKNIRKKWETVFFPFRVNKMADVNELTFVFAHDRVGTFPRGMVEMRNMTILPKPDPAVSPEKEKAMDTAILTLDESPVTGPSDQ